MEYVILVLLIIILVLLVILLMRKNNTELETRVVREIGDFKNDFTRSINDDFNKLNERLNDKIRFINDALNERLDDNFSKTNKTFQSVLERLAKIDEAQKKIDNLSMDIVSLESILTDKKTRGIFGEINLNLNFNFTRFTFFYLKAKLFPSLICMDFFRKFHIYNAIIWKFHVVKNATT